MLALAIMLCFQVFFSFYYSSEIVEQNQRLYKNQEKWTNLQLKAEKLNENWSMVSSLKEIETKASSFNLVPINNKIENE